MKNQNDTKNISYRVPAGYGEAEFVEKRSRFIGRVWRVENEEEAKARVSAMQKQFFDATHNVYAYIINAHLMRYSDDGEPQGTAGLPTLNVLEQEEVSEVCCIVTRYYGGTLLGAGGLVRAYAKAAKLGLHAAGLLTMRLWDQLQLTCPYSLYDQIKILIQNNLGMVEATDFAADVTLNFSLPATNTDSFKRNLQTLSAGSLCPKMLDTVFMGK